MIIHLKKNTTSEILDDMTKQLKAFHIKQENRELLITSSGLKEIPTQFENYVEENGSLIQICSFLLKLIIVTKLR